LTLYYATAFTIAGFFFHPALAWFTPVGAFGEGEIAKPVSIGIGILLQIAASICLVFTMRQRLAPSLSASAPSGARSS
jgi:hypothetical protein